MSREEIALQITLKMFDSLDIIGLDKSFIPNDEANIKIAKAAAEFFNAVYENLSDITKA